mgnify:CR=1 FL=1
MSSKKGKEVDASPARQAAQKSAATLQRVLTRAREIGVLGESSVTATEGDPIPKALQVMHGASLTRSSHARKSRRVFCFPGQITSMPTASFELTDINTSSPSLLVRFPDQPGALRFSGTTVKMASPLIGLKATGSSRTERSMDVFGVHREIVVLADAEWIDEATGAPAPPPAGIFQQSILSELSRPAASTSTASLSQTDSAAESQQVIDADADASEVEEFTDATPSPFKSDRPVRASRATPKSAHLRLFCVCIDRILLEYALDEEDESADEEDDEEEEDGSGEASGDDDGDDNEAGAADEEADEEEEGEEEEDEADTSSVSASPSRRKRQVVEIRDDSDDEDYVDASPSKKSGGRKR